MLKAALLLTSRSSAAYLHACSVRLPVSAVAQIVCLAEVFGALFDVPEHKVAGRQRRGGLGLVLALLLEMAFLCTKQWACLIFWDGLRSRFSFPSQCEKATKSHLPA